MKKPYIKGIEVKKRLGQHFLKDAAIVHRMRDYVKLDANSHVFEIGCGEGILTRAILERHVKKLVVFEIDPEWADHVRQLFPDKKLDVRLVNFLDVDLQTLKPEAPWVVLANLPYQITFPILHKLLVARDLISEGVVMIQEEVAQKIVKEEGRGYGYSSLYFQHYFELKLLEKISPISFFPPPKIYSRLLYFKPRAIVRPIQNEEEFWKFIKMIFLSPRRTVRNNLAQSHYDLGRVSEDVLKLRAQQMDMPMLLDLWNILIRE